MSSYTPGVRQYEQTRLEAVVICLNYSDFLAETLPFTISQFDRVVVVTAHNDMDTKNICHKWSVECVVTDAFVERGDVFNKGAAINVGLANLRQNGWIVQLDADIVVPLQLRNMLAKAGLQTDCLYGVERFNVHSYEKWAKIRPTCLTEPQFSHRYFVNAPDLPACAHVVHKEFGYVPIGFFQLWHSQFMHQHMIRYPDVESSAENMDVQFALRWPRTQRRLLPTVRVLHLESEKSPMGANWRGRKTPPFTENGLPLKTEAAVSYAY